MIVRIKVRLKKFSVKQVFCLTLKFFYLQIAWHLCMVTVDSWNISMKSLVNNIFYSSYLDVPCSWANFPCLSDRTTLWCSNMQKKFTTILSRETHLPHWTDQCKCLTCMWHKYFIITLNYTCKTILNIS